MGGASTEIGEAGRGRHRSTSCWRRRTSTRPSIARGRPPAQAAQRGVAALRAGRRPAAAAGGRRAGGAAAGRARRRHDRAPVARTPGPRRPSRPGAHAAGAARPRRRRGVRARRHGPPAAARWAAASSSTRGPTGTASSSRPRRRGGRTSCRPPTWSRRCCGWRATTRSRRCSRPRPPGRGLTPAQLRRRAVSSALAETGSVEVLPFPFVGPAVWDAFGLPADDVRRRTVPVVNPLDADRAALATTLLPGPARRPGAQPVARLHAT